MSAAPWSSIPAGPYDVRLVVCDMDGTLLTAAGDIPETFWPLLEGMRSRGITFVPASGRPHATLASLFEHVGPDMAYIAENGNLVAHQGEVVDKTCVDAAVVREVIEVTRDAARHSDHGLVLSGLRSAYVERSDPAFIAEVERYYIRLEVVEDLTAVSDDILKLAVFDFADAHPAASTTFGRFAESHQVVVSGEHWIDIMTRGVDKGRAVRSLQQAMGVTPAQTAVFGDYLNDLEMLSAGEWSFAMANAHPTIRSEARYLAPTNEEYGVVTALGHLLAH